MTTATSGLRVDDAAVKRMFKGVNLSARQSKKAWRKFTQYMRVKTDQTFNRLRKGGSYRGVTWSYFKPQYTRKDGTVVPAWGGVPRLRKGRSARTSRGTLRKGGKIARTSTKNVMGRLRPSGTRGKRGDSLMQDTMAMRSRAVNTIVQTNERLEMGPSLSYARAQQNMRMFLFFEVPRDVQALVKIFAGHLRRGAKTGKAP